MGEAFHPFSFFRLPGNFHAVALPAAMGAGKAAGLGGVVQGKHLAEPGPENPVAGRADVGHPASIKPGHPQPQGDDHRHSQKEGPEDSGFPPKDGGGNLDDVHDDSHGNENPTKIGELFSLFI